MRIAVTGSIATDHLMTFPARFVDQLMPDKLDKIALSFLVDTLVIRRGGVAANIAFGLGCLGLRPLLVGTAGQATSPTTGEWLERHGVDTKGVRESAEHHTARYIGTTDAGHEPDRVVLSGRDDARTGRSTWPSWPARSSWS